MVRTHKAWKDVSEAREWPMFHLKAGWSFSLAGHMKLAPLKSDFGSGLLRFDTFR